MASQEERDGANGSRPVNNGSALSMRTASGTELALNDPWTARIVVTAVSGVGVYLAKNLVTFLCDNPEMVKSAIQLAFQAWGEVKDVKPGSVIVDLDCGSQKKYSEFRKDFDDGKVKDAMEKEFCKIGYKEKLEMTLKERDVATMEISKESFVRETKKITFVNPKAEVRGDPQGADNPNKEDVQLPSQKRKQASSSTEVKQEEESCSAAKKSKLDPVREPGTSGVSSTSKTMKEGVVTDDDLQTLGKAIGSKWDQLGRRLPGITNDDIEEIDDMYKALSKKGYHILNRWKTNNAKAADYKTLHDALVHKLVQRKDLAQDYCFEK